MTRYYPRPIFASPDTAPAPIRVSQISIYASCVSAILRICCPFFGAKDPHILNLQKCRVVSQKCSSACVGNALQTPLISYFTLT